MTYQQNNIMGQYTRRNGMKLEKLVIESVCMRPHTSFEEAAHGGYAPGIFLACEGV